MKALFRTLLAAAVILVGLAPARAQEWVEIRSPHFSVFTDAGDARGRQVAERFEEMRAAFGVLFRRSTVNLPVPLEIIAFRSGKQFRRFVPLWKGKPVEISGLFQGGEDRNFIALDLSAAPEQWGIVFHEYAHLLLHGNFPPLPTWYDEGFAEYCSSLQVDKKEIRFGLIAPGRPQQLQESSWMHIVDLFSVKQDSKQYNEASERSGFYAQSWVTVHYIMGHQKWSETSRYLELTMQQGMPVAEAIRQAFKMEPRQLENAVREYFTTRRMRYYRLPAPADLAKGPYNVRKLGEPEWQSVRADLHYHSIDHHEEGVAEFRAIVKNAPDNAAANRGLGYVYLKQNDFAQAAEHFRRAAAADSQDPQAHYLIALLMNREALTSGRPPQDLAEMKKHVETAISLKPAFADAYNLLAYCEALAGNGEAELAAIQKAIELNPGNEFYRLNLAQYELKAQHWDVAENLLKHLAASGNVELARIAETLLENVANMRRPTRTAATSPRTIVTAPQWEPKETTAEERPAQEPPAPPPQIQPIKFLKGKLIRVDCSAAPQAVLTIAASGKTWTMHTKDVKSLLLIGADSFSCGWAGKQVYVNFRQKADGQGEIVSLEID